MKRLLLFILLAIIAITSGRLMAKASWISKVGMTFFYKEYNFTKVWWQGALFVFGFFLALYVVHSLIQRLSALTSKTLHVLLLLTAAALLYYSYCDFRDDLTHHLLRRRFHYGVYLIWIGWMAIALYFAFSRENRPGSEAQVESR